MPSAERIRTAITAFVDASSPGEPRRWAVLAATDEAMGAATRPPSAWYFR